MKGLMEMVLYFSLLDVLADRKDRSGLTGDVLIDGHRMPTDFKCMSGYVVQVSEEFSVVVML